MDLPYNEHNLFKQHLQRNSEIKGISFARTDVNPWSLILFINIIYYYYCH